MRALPNPNGQRRLALGPWAWIYSLLSIIDCHCATVHVSQLVVTPGIYIRCTVYSRNHIHTWYQVPVPDLVSLTVLGSYIKEGEETSNPAGLPPAPRQVGVQSTGQDTRSARHQRTRTRNLLIPFWSWDKRTWISRETMTTHTI